MSTYKYSRWDGSQQVFQLDEDGLLEALADDILSRGDVEGPRRSMYRRGVRGEGAEDSVQGPRDLTERLKQQRQRQLDRYNLDSLMDDID
jgi:hypothetical protein